MDNRPFESLSSLLARKKVRLPEVALPEPPECPLTPAEERKLFREAMADVIPLADRPRVGPQRIRPAVYLQEDDDPDAEALRKLQRLVETGEGFKIRHTAEYMQGGPRWLPPELFRRIHGGYFSVRDHVDLHGLNLAAAKHTFENFMRNAVAAGKRTVLIVHGRGRRSPGPPVLKGKLFEWLSRKPWKRWVIAFTSARSCDGGTGATYVLLRRTPQPGRRP
jgi:DNA-nicking Smr family endonuclease